MIVVIIVIMIVIVIIYDTNDNNMYGKYNDNNDGCNNKIACGPFPPPRPVVVWLGLLSRLCTAGW